MNLLKSRALVVSTAALLAIMLGSCSGNAVNPQAYNPRATTAPASSGKPGVKPTALSRELAWLRTRQIAQVAYNLWFGIDAEHEDFEGRVVANFELRDLKKSLSVAAHETNETNARDLYNELKEVAQTLAMDFEGGTIRSIAINGATVDPKQIPGNRGERYDGHRIYFHVSELAPGANRINIAFSHPFQTDGYGFHRFRDPVDKHVYVYTHFEPYGAHRMFPCFDQPDLKASFELTVESPEDWQVISNTLERDVTTVDGRKSWAFPISPVISTYLFALHAGPFQMWHEDAEGIPMRLFARQSLKPYIDPKEWFDTTRKGLEYFSVFNGYPYPYAKYDQIIVPDFNAGAMENAAAITFSEHFVRRTRSTMANKRGLAATILHEMAHQWFGDLVTMKWWNGLWLNESFATFMATKALDEATHFPDAWLSFNAEKEWAYQEDQRVTTHPVEVPVTDTDQAETIFDGISYGKGAAVLNQLLFYLDEDDFREGLQRYFQKYALRNTTTRDFMKMLGEASDKDLLKWQKSWLQTAGLTGVSVDWACATNEDGKSTISKFNLVQTPPEGGSELHSHRTEIAFYDTEKNGSGKLHLRKKDILTATYAGATTAVPEAVGKPCPSFVYPNHNDRDYAKVDLDPVSLKAAALGVESIESTLQRQMIWNTLSQMVNDGRMKAQDLADAILAQSAQERNIDLLARLLAMFKNPLQYMPVPMRMEYQAKIEAFAIKHMKGTPPGSDEQRVWITEFERIGQSPAAIKLARDLLTGGAKLPGFAVMQQDRWNLIQTLAAAGASDASQLIDAELARDNTDMGQNSAIAARAAIPTAAAKKEAWGQIIAPLEDPAHALPIAKLRNAMWSFSSIFHEDQIRPYVDAYFEALPKLEKISDSQFAHYFAGALFPSLCEQRIVDLTSAVLRAHPDLPPLTVKSLKIHRQDEERCIIGRAKAQAQTQATTPQP
ncbi:MAG: aminopeptidase N [Oligoflexia bacterium]|nr:aminopeptidase N [Oligoflexia bacterium]